MYLSNYCAKFSALKRLSPTQTFYININVFKLKLRLIILLEIGCAKTEPEGMFATHWIVSSYENVNFFK